MDALLIANPNASSTSDRVVDNVAAELSRRHRVEVARTRHRGHASELAAAGVADGVDLVVSLGGDGTANEVLQSVAETDVALAVLPGGGANVLARTLGLPEHPVKAAALLAPADAAPTRRRIGLGRANERWFAVSAGLGFDATVVNAVERHAQLKRFLGDAAFVALGLAEWFSSTDRHTTPIEIELADGTVHDGFWAVVASNSDPFTWLGALPMRLTPGTTFDGGIDVLAVKGTNTRHVLGLVGKVFAGARHEHDPVVRTFRGLDGLTIRTPRPRPFQVDGDAAGTTQSLEIVRCPHAVEVLVPT